MTKAEWISVIQNTIKPGDEAEQYRAPFIERHLQSVYEQMYNELYRQDKQSIYQYLVKVTATDSIGADLSVGYTMPSVPISLPRVSGGVFEFSTTGRTYVLTDRKGYNNVANTLFDTAGFKGQYVAYIDATKIYANNTNTAGNIMTWYMIPKLTSLTTSSEVKIPGGMEDHFIDRVIDTIQHMPPVDLMNDNA